MMPKWKNVVNETYPKWDFEKEKVLEGVLVEKRNNVGPNNSNLYVVEQKGGDKTSVWGSTVLNKISTLPVGALVKIEYKGEAMGKNNRKYKDYLIQVDEETMPESDIDLSAL